MRWRETHMTVAARPPQHLMYIETAHEMIPASLEDALREDRALLANIQQVNADLTTARERADVIDPAWRRRAIDAQRHMTARHRFLKHWIFTESRKAQASEFAEARADLSNVLTTTLIRDAAKRVGFLE